MVPSPFGGSSADYEDTEEELAEEEPADELGEDSDGSPLTVRSEQRRTSINLDSEMSVLAQDMQA